MQPAPRTSVIIPAAGSGSRMAARDQSAETEHVPKQLLEVNGRPLLAHTLAIWAEIECVESIIVACPPGCCEQYMLKFMGDVGDKSLSVVEGGATRAESVLLALDAVPDEIEIVAVHDGARPLVSAALIMNCIIAASGHRAVIPGVAPSSTVKEIKTDSRLVKATHDRNQLRLIQTPQCFEAGLLRDAYNHAIEQSLLQTATDDASIVEAYGEPVTIIPGEYRNIKVTYGDDLLFFEAVLKNIAPKT